ncbi:hypothetical protein AKJ49_00320 [candidate division MSBL1 archaeon SCGC-AAA382A03]|uniref:Uncharacterized protein n=1 Tax=candidate division MSBL1 archaeon SCGC-AAA382A03 TaxID=1698278 RepID=A0A133VGV0_9EURY|nr:hypothetical protein AKJ49_00320 [candidate division MSBL1 archaeon SCGC-AAA382A03]
MAEEKVEKEKEERKQEEERKRRGGEEETRGGQRREKTETKQDKGEGEIKDLISVELPTIELEEPHISEKEFKSAEKIPRLEKEERKTPELKVEEAEVQERKVKIDSEIPAIEEEEEELKTVPIVRISPPKIRSKMRTFDDSEPRIRERPKRKISVPVYRKRKSPRIRSKVRSFVSDIRKDVNERLEALKRKAQEQEKRTEEQEESEKSEEVDRTEEEEQAYATSVTPEAGAGVSGGEEELDFYDFFLEFSGNKQLVVNPEDPVAVVVAEEEDEEFERTVQHICRDIYRERIGGLPFPEDLSIENKKEIERRLTENRISVVEEDLSTFLSEGFQVGIKEIEKEDEKIAKEIQNFYTQNLGFLLLPVQGNREAKKFKNRLEESALPERPYISLLEQKIGGELKEKISKCAWGFIDIDPSGESLDSYYLEGERGFKDRLKDMVKDSIYSKMTDKDPNPDITESSTHLDIKAFIVRHLAKRRNLNSRRSIEKSKIETEPFGAEEKGPRPDVKVENECYEVETLFGEGVDPEHEIIRKIELYCEPDQGYELNFVLPNLTLLRYLPFLKGEKKHWESKGYDIGFYTLDLAEGELIPLSDVKNYITEEIRPFVAKPES